MFKFLHNVNRDGSILKTRGRMLQRLNMPTQKILLLVAVSCTVSSLKIAHKVESPEMTFGSRQIHVESISPSPM